MHVVQNDNGLSSLKQLCSFYLFFTFLADRTYGRAIGTLLHLLRYVLWLNGAS